MSDDAADLYKAQHPLVLCTDDVGVFSTSLSGEYKLAASAFGRSDVSVAFYKNMIGKLTDICFISSIKLLERGNCFSWQEMQLNMYLQTI